MRLRHAVLGLLCSTALALSACGSDGDSPFDPQSSGASSGGGSASTSGGGSGSSSNDVPDGGTPITTSDFTLTLPKGYREDKSKESGQLIAFYSGPVIGNFAVNVNITRDIAGSTTLQTFYTSSLDQLKKTLQIRQLSDPASLTIDGDQAIRYTFEDTQNGIELKQGQVLVIHAGYGYVFTYTAPVPNFSEQSALAAQLIQSLRWK